MNSRKSLGTLLLALFVSASTGASRSDGRDHPAAFSVETNVDFIDMTHYTSVPLDDRWFERIFSNCRKHSVRRVYWRVALGRAYFRSQIMAHVSAEGNTEKRIIEFAKILDSDIPEPLAQAVKFAHRHGIELVAWFPFNEAYYERPGTRNLIDPWYAERTHLFWCDRSGDRVWMGMPCVAEAEVVDRIASIVAELCDYGVDAVYLTPRTHCYRPWAGRQDPFDVHTDQFGYNEPIRQRYRASYGVDIRTEEFDVEKWHSIKGQFYTEMLSECARVAHEKGKKLLAGTLPERVSYAASAYPTALRLENDWQDWHQTAKVDGIVSIQARIRLPEGSQVIPDNKVMETTLDVSPIVEAAPQCPVTIFHPVLVFRPAGGGSWSLKDRIIEPVAVLQKRIDMARQQGASSFLIHEGYIPLMLDTAGTDYGVGATPMQEYWDAMKRWNK